ncbi:hypothetical protein ADEAN_000770900 [Angomonas deanei]|uniref:Uncharacterized protein n=1 Tax=Angomonas deanei TaxID=59799 RepID=A0A7G2CMM5_9TRYP|nr:hypothetical protein ADEAN_000770900 [Angomonas deanei]
MSEEAVVSFLNLTVKEKTLLQTVVTRNPLLLNQTLRAQTIGLLHNYTNTNVFDVLRRSVQDRLLAGESAVVCVSLDGEHYFSPDYYDAFGAADPSSEKNASVPLYLKTDPVLTSRTPEEEDSLRYRVGNYYARDMSVLIPLLVRVVETTADSGSSSEASGVTINQTSLMTLNLTDAAMEQFVVAVQTAVGLPNTSNVLLAQLQPTADVDAPTAEDVETLQKLSQEPSLLGEEEPTLYGSHSESKPTGSPATPLKLKTYVLTLSVATDVLLADSTLLNASEILYRATNLIRNNTYNGPLLQELIHHHNTVVSPYKTVVAPLSSSFYFSNGAALSSAMFNTTTGAFMPSSATTTLTQTLFTKFYDTPAERASRVNFFAINSDSVNAEPVPDDPNNDTSSKLSWWTIPLLLIVPICVILGTYFVYKKYFKKPKEGEEAQEVTVTVTPEEETA